jgi:hypothetical protein
MELSVQFAPTDSLREGSGGVKHGRPDQGALDPRMGICYPPTIMGLFKSCRVRSALATISILTLLSAGCANEQVIMPSGQDHAELTAKIARQGQDGPDLTNVHEREQPDRYDSPALKSAVKVAQVAAAITVCCAFLAPLYALAYLGHGNLSGLRPDLANSQTGS